MRITKKVFLDLAIWMVCFGILIGIIFPFFTVSFGFDRNVAFSWKYFTACIIAGIVVALVNFTISKITVANRLRVLISKMNNVQKQLIKISKGGSLKDRSPEEFLIKVDSDDELGMSASAFNNLVKVLFVSFLIERTVQDYTKILSSTLDLKTLSEKALLLILQSTNSTGGMILLEREGELTVFESIAIKNPEELKNSTIFTEVLKTSNNKIIRMPENIVIDGLFVNYRPTEIIIQPLIYSGIPIGVLALSNTKNYTSEDITLIEMFSISLSISLNNAIIHEQMQKLAAIDPLTGLLNKRYGNIRLKEEFSRAVRTEGFLGIIMFDIDYFKKINDTYGHIAGDRLLVHISRLVKSLIREGDIIIRYGGEEFCIVLPGASSNDTYKMAERIRIAVQESEINYSVYRLTATISLGVASYPETNVSNEQELLNCADEALYTSKKLGRNRTTVK